MEQKSRQNWHLKSKLKSESKPIIWKLDKPEWFLSLMRYSQTENFKVMTSSVAWDSEFSDVRDQKSRSFLCWGRLNLVSGEVLLGPFPPLG